VHQVTGCTEKEQADLNIKDKDKASFVRKGRQGIPG